MSKTEFKVPANVDAELVKRLVEALAKARTLIIGHHNVGKMSELRAGSSCPVCCDDTGASHTLDEIYAVLDECRRKGY